MQWVVGGHACRGRGLKTHTSSEPGRPVVREVAQARRVGANQSMGYPAQTTSSKSSKVSTLMHLPEGLRSVGPAKAPR